MSLRFKRYLFKQPFNWVFWKVASFETVSGRGSTVSLREMQIKTSTRYHFTLTKMAVTKEKEITKCWKGHGETGTLDPCQWACTMVLLFGKQVGSSSKSLNTAAMWPSLPLSGTHPRGMKILSPQKRVQTLIAVLFVIAKKWKQLTYLPTNEWMDKMWYFQTMEYYWATKRKYQYRPTLVNQNRKGPHIVFHLHEMSRISQCAVRRICCCPGQGVGGGWGEGRTGE